MTRFACFALPLLVACAPAQPFSGPGFDADNDRVLSDSAGPFVAVITHTKVAKGEAGLFNDHVDGILDQLEKQPGYVGGSLKGQLFGRERWTLTVWDDPQALVAFRDSGAHQKAMDDQDTVVEQVYYAYWELDKSEVPPSWDTALKELDKVEPEDPFAD